MLDVSGPLGLIRNCYMYSYAKQETLLALQEFEETKFGFLEPSSGPTVVWRHAHAGLHRIGVGHAAADAEARSAPIIARRGGSAKGARRLVVAIVFADTTTQSLTPRLRP